MAKALQNFMSTFKAESTDGKVRVVCDYEDVPYDFEDMLGEPEHYSVIKLRNSYGYGDKNPVAVGTDDDGLVDVLREFDDDETLAIRFMRIFKGVKNIYETTLRGVSQSDWLDVIIYEHSDANLEEGALAEVEKELNEVMRGEVYAVVSYAKITGETQATNQVTGETINHPYEEWDSIESVGWVFGYENPGSVIDDLDLVPDGYTSDDFELVD
ncbi:hypothetical protein EOM57_05175 [Candidatus Saccharibacteria bacterium]|nr:hypothetical protein [Candidatus Saccharibacteria bacterium]